MIWWNITHYHQLLKAWCYIIVAKEKYFLFLVILLFFTTLDIRNCVIISLTTRRNVDKISDSRTEKETRDLRQIHTSKRRKGVLLLFFNSTNITPQNGYRRIKVDYQNKSTRISKTL